LVTIGGKSTIVEAWAGGALAVNSCIGLSGAGGAGRNASKAAPALAARQTTIAHSINDPLRDSLTATPWGNAESDISAPVRMA
jgi:hypothetical protein